MWTSQHGTQNVKTHKRYTFYPYQDKQYSVVNGQCTISTLRTYMLDCIPSKYSVNSEPDFKVNHVTIATTTLKFVTCCTDRFFVGFLLLDL